MYFVGMNAKDRKLVNVCWNNRRNKSRLKMNLDAIVFEENSKEQEEGLMKLGPDR